MSLPEDVVNLVRDSPFKQLVLMELERENIYQSFVLVDELLEISSRWLNFADFCSKTLYNVTSLANLLYHRYYDEYKRDKKEITDDSNREIDISTKIEDLQEFQMEAAILINLYADMVNKGIFDSGPYSEYSTLHIEGIRILNNISSVYYNSHHPQSSKIEEVMLSLLLLNQNQLLIDQMEEMQEKIEKETIFREKGRYYLALAEFDSSFVSRLIRHVGERKKWWWKDPILMYYTFDRSNLRLEKSREYFSQLSDDSEMVLKKIESREIPITKAWKNQTLVEHYLRLTLEAAKEDNFRACFEYLNLIEGLNSEIRKVFQHIQPNRVMDKELKEENQKQTRKCIFYKEMGKISLLTHQIFNLLANESSTKEIKSKVKEIEDILNASTITLNTNFLGSLPLVHMNFVKEVKIGLLKRNQPNVILTNVEKTFHTFIHRIETVITEIVQELSQFQILDETVSMNKLNQMLETIVNVKHAVFFLPEQEQKEELIFEIEALEYRIRSLALTIRTEKKQSNEVLKLLYYAKSHYYSSKALEVIQKSRKKIVPRPWVEKWYSQTFLLGQEMELKLFELSLQYLFLNTVLDWLVRTFKFTLQHEESIGKNYRGIIEDGYSHFLLFETMNKRVHENCNEMLNHRQLFDTSDVKINWKVIEAKKILSYSLSELLEATKKAILGYASITYKDTYQAPVFFNEALKHVKKASQELEKIANIEQSISQLVSQIYEYSLFLLELERKSRDKEKLPEFPMNTILTAMKQLIFIS